MAVIAAAAVAIVVAAAIDEVIRREGGGIAAGSSSVRKSASPLARWRHCRWQQQCEEECITASASRMSDLIDSSLASNCWLLDSSLASNFWPTALSSFLILIFADAKDNCLHPQQRQPPQGRQ